MAKSRVVLVKRPPSASISMRVVNRNVTKQMSQVADVHIDKRKVLVRPWEPDNQGKFTKEVSSKPAKITVKVKHTAKAARKANVSVYQLLDDGTKVRHVKMASNFRPQTMPGVVTSKPKQGGVIKNNQGEPIIFFNADPDGIEARNFDDVINEELLPVMIEAIETGYRISAEQLSK